MTVPTHGSRSRGSAVRCSQVQAAQTPGLESHAGLMAEALNGGAQRLGEALLELLKALRGLGFEIQTNFCESVSGLENRTKMEG